MSFGRETGSCKVRYSIISALLLADVLGNSWHAKCWLLVCISYVSYVVTCKILMPLLPNAHNMVI